MKLKHGFMAILLARCIFLAMPDTSWTPFLFPSSEMRVMTAHQYTWVLFELLSFFYIVGILWAVMMRWIEITPGRIRSVGVFLLMCGLDLADFMIRGNSEWFYFGQYPVTNNIFMVGAYPILTWGAETTQ